MVHHAAEVFYVFQVSRKYDHASPMGGGSFFPDTRAVREGRDLGLCAERRWMVGLRPVAAGRGEWEAADVEMLLSMKSTPSHSFASSRFTRFTVPFVPVTSQQPRLCSFRFHLTLGDPPLTELWHQDGICCFGRFWHLSSGLEASAVDAKRTVEPQTGRAKKRRHELWGPGLPWRPRVVCHNSQMQHNATSFEMLWVQMVGGMARMQLLPLWLGRSVAPLFYSCI